jgi:acyl dehydratase
VATSTFTEARHDRYFEDYVIGSTFTFGPILVEEAEVVSFAKRFDPQTMHIDREAAKHGPFKGLIASGWHTTSLMMRLYVEHYLSAVASLSSPGIDELRWHHPVRPGDLLRLRVTVIDSRLSRSKSDRGIVVSLLEAVNHDDIVVCSLKQMNLLATRQR